MKRKVFVPSVPTRFDPVEGGRVPAIDLRPATTYGELVVMCRARSPLQQSDLPTMSELRAQLAELRPEDYVLAAGDPVLIGMTLAAALTVQPRVLVLRWSRTAADYDCLEVAA